MNRSREGSDTMLEFEFHFNIQAESFDYVVAIEWRMKIQIQQDKPHGKWTSIAQEFIVFIIIISGVQCITNRYNSNA